jgi:hypothetical protein
MKNEETQCFQSEDGEISLYFGKYTPAGKVHDFLMYMKAVVVERMVEAHKEHLMQVETMKALEAQSQEQPQEKCQPCAEASCTPSEG